MHKTQIVSILILASLWLIAGLRLFWSGSFLLMSASSKVKGYMLIFGLIFAIALGFLKGRFVLTKAVQGSLKRAENLNQKPVNYFLGWAKVLGLQGFLMVFLMFLLGLLLSGPSSPLDDFSKGLLLLVIGMALLVGSSNFWLEFKK